MNKKTSAIFPLGSRLEAFVSPQHVLQLLWSDPTKGLGLWTRNPFRGLRTLGHNMRAQLFRLDGYEGE